MARNSQEWKARVFDYKYVRVDAHGNKKSVKHRNRCLLCGRPRGFIRKFNMCRLCFRGLALRGEIPGVIKSSW